MENISELKRQYAIGVYQTGSLLIKEVPFDLRSGGKSHIYLNHRNFLSQAKYLELISKIYLQILSGIKGNFKLGIVDSLMSPVLVGALAMLGNFDFVLVKREKLEHGTKENIFGDPSGNVVLIDDMTSTGGTLIETAEILKKLGGIVKHCIVSACRNDEAKTILSEHKIQLHCVASFNEIINELTSQLTSLEKQLIEKEYS
jgi:orotate phosphoribosyltransferase